MTVPPAIVNSPRPPLSPKPATADTVRRVLAVAIIAGAGFACWKMLRPYWRGEGGKAADAYDAKLDAARKKLGDGLDPLLDQLSYDEHTVDLVAAFTRDPSVPVDYNDAGCARGFDDAFALALGDDKLISFSTLGMHHEVKLAIAAKLSRSDTSFQLPNSEKPYPGIRMHANLELLGKKLTVDLEPPANIEFTHYRLAYDLGGITDSDVAMGIVQGTCKEAGLALIESMTTWKRPAPLAPPDPVAECLDQGFHCRDNAIALEGAEPAKAAKLYAKACDNGDDDACVHGADLEIGQSKGIDDHAAQAHVMLQMACMREMRRSCAAAGRIRLLPITPGHEVGPTQEREALLFDTRACDLGDDTGCAQAAPLLAKLKPFPTLKPFAVKWGQWTQYDSGQLTAWVTSEVGVPSGYLVRGFDAADAPKGVVVPADVSRVYAVAAQNVRMTGDTPCMRCMPSGRSPSPLTMPSMSCVCALAPPAPAAP